MKLLHPNRLLRLRTKLYVSYLSILIGFTLVCVWSINSIVKEQFANYAKDKLDRRNKEIIEEILTEFKAKKTWKNTSMDSIGMKALERGLIIKVKNLDGSMIWDARRHHNGLCTTMISNMSKNMTDLYRNWEGGYTERIFNLSLGEKDFGLLEVGYIGPYYFSDIEIALVKDVNNIIYIVGTTFALLSILIASLIAKNISGSITSVIETTEKISKGDYSGKLDKVSNILEFNSLLQSVNLLSEKLQEQKMLRRQLSEDVAHELRTPITNLQSHLEAMIDGVWEIDVSRLNSLMDESKRISRLIGNLEVLENLESKCMKLNMQEIELSHLIERIIFSLDRELKKKNISVQYDFNINKITADKDKITQVFMNIISNGIHYSSQNGLIQIQAEIVNHVVWIHIKDYGIGIHGKDMKHIFERFYRVDKSRNRKTGGAGIGLSISKAIIEAHGGEISVISKLGEGAEFIIKLPTDKNEA